MRRIFALALFLGFVTTTVLAQSRLTGKWNADRPADPLSITGDHRNQNVQLEVIIEGDKASGTLSLGGLGGTFYIIQDGKVTGNKLQFRPDSNPSLPLWTIELVDDNTVMLYREGLPMVGSNVLDLIAALGRTSQSATPVPVVAVSRSTVSSSIRGSVQDQSKARIPGVTVTATNVDTGTKVTTTTNDAGVYRFSGLPQGKYTMTASLSGFSPTTIRSLDIGDSEVLQDLTLEFPAPRPPTPTAASCSGNGIVWCALLHRTK